MTKSLIDQILLLQAGIDPRRVGHDPVEQARALERVKNISDGKKEEENK